jgi:hypothetical protein
MDHTQEFIQEWYPDEDEASFFIKVRLRSVWDEEHFLRMERTAHVLLDDMKQDVALRERWRNAFTEVIAHIKNLLQHPGFLAKNKLSMTKEQYRAYIEQRVERFEALKRRYEAITGRSVPPLSGAKASARREPPGGTHAECPRGNRRTGVARRSKADAALALLAQDGDEILTSDPEDLRVLVAASGVHADVVGV